MLARPIGIVPTTVWAARTRASGARRNDARGWEWRRKVADSFDSPVDEAPLYVFSDALLGLLDLAKALLERFGIRGFQTW